VLTFGALPCPSALGLSIIYRRNGYIIPPGPASSPVLASHAVSCADANPLAVKIRAASDIQALHDVVAQLANTASKPMLIRVLLRCVGSRAAVFSGLGWADDNENEFQFQPKNRREREKSCIRI
jgi:hypothetical protein